MDVDNKLLMDAVAAINARFSSGNSVPVDRAWVTEAEWKNLQFALSLALAPPEGYAEQHARDSRELRSLCAARDEARRERDMAKNESLRMRSALKKIVGYRLDQFTGPYDMATACIYDAENALPDSEEVPDGRG